MNKSCLLLILLTLSASADTIDYEVLPKESRTTTDPVTGVELSFLTTAPGKDLNTYIYQDEWLCDDSMVLFNSDRNDGGAMGYIVRTGELIKLRSPKGPLRQPVASVHRPMFYARRGREVVETKMQFDLSDQPDKTPSRVHGEERFICLMPEGEHSSYLTENPDGTKLTMGIMDIVGKDYSAIYTIDIASGEITEVCRFPNPPGFGWHVQWDWTDPNLILFAGRPMRLMAIDVRDGIPRNLYKSVDTELVTHESSWVDGQVLFCGGVHPKPTEDAHLKVLNLKTGEVRILGAGAWWPEASAAELAKWNWWHASGSRDGRWAAADNWHGDIMLFEAKTTRPRLLTTGHRTYGKGEHPHVSWHPKGTAVVFTSEMLGDPNVCVARIPDAWQAENP